MVVFEKCDSKVRTCKDEKTINEWLKYKYILTYTNNKHFISHEFGDKKLYQNSEIGWFALNAL